MSTEVTLSFSRSLSSLSCMCMKKKKKASSSPKDFFEAIHVETLDHPHKCSQGDSSRQFCGANHKPAERRRQRDTNRVSRSPPSSSVAFWTPPGPGVGRGRGPGGGPGRGRRLTPWRTRAPSRRQYASRLELCGRRRRHHPPPLPPPDAR